MKETSTGWGGARPHSGRKGNCTEQISTRVPSEVVKAVQAAADSDGVSLSGKTCEILKNWARRNPVKE